MVVVAQEVGGNVLSAESDSERVEEESQARDASVGMKTDKMKFLGLAVLLALFTGACASDDAEGAPPTVIIERDRGGSAPVIIERDADDKDVDVDVDVDKE